MLPPLAIRGSTGRYVLEPFERVLIISGVAMDLVGAAVLSHAHNAESMVEIREEIGTEKSALGEEDAFATQAQLLAGKRIGFFILTLGLSLYLAGLVLKSTEGVRTMAALAVGVVVVGLVGTALWVRIRGRKFRREIREAQREGCAGGLVLAPHEAPPRRLAA